MLKYNILTIALLLCLISCSQRESPQSGKQVLRLNFYAEPLTIDPRQSTYSVYTNIFPMLYDGLMRFNPQGQLVPAIAESVEISPDGKKYVFKLRRAEWSCGEPLTAADFEQAWKWILNPKSPSTMARNFYILKNAKLAKEGRVPMDQVGVRALDPHTLEVELDHPAPYFLELTAHYAYFPFLSVGDTNGPFRVETWDAGRQMVLKKNLRYWDTSEVKLDEIRISFIPDILTEYRMFENRELDWTGAPTSPSLPAEAIEKLQHQDKFWTHPSYFIYYYTFNTERPPLKSKMVRKALSYAIPREDIVNHITLAGEIPAYRFVPDHKGELPALSDEEIRNLFDEGLKEQNLCRDDLKKIVISYNAVENHHKIAQLIQDRWTKLFDINVSLENKGWGLHLNDLKEGRYDVGRLMWKGIAHDGEHFLDLFLEPEHPMNCCRWKNSEFENHMQAAISGNDRSLHLAQADDVLWEEMPVAPIFIPTIPYSKNPKLKNEVLSDLGTVDFKWAMFEK